jgi:hypothetical protein
MRNASGISRTARSLLAAAATLLFGGAGAAPLGTDEIAALCTTADGPVHCGRKIEEVQLKRLPRLATRDGGTLTVTLYPSGTTAFTDKEALSGGRFYSLWDFLDSINAVIVFTINGDETTFTVLQRTNGRQVELPAEPRVSPDRQRLVTADFCPARCVNELAVWRVGRDGITKELVWKPAEAWADAAATWTDADTIAVEYTAAGQSAGKTLTRKLGDAGWRPAKP